MFGHLKTHVELFIFFWVLKIGICTTIPWTEFCIMLLNPDVDIILNNNRPVKLEIFIYFVPENCLVWWNKGAGQS